MHCRCKALDAAADGYGRSEAVGSVVLLPLQATQNGLDQAVQPASLLLRGSAVNQDGRSSSLTAPNGPAQQAVIRRALAAAMATATDVGILHSASSSRVDDKRRIPVWPGRCERDRIMLLRAPCCVPLILASLMQQSHAAIRRKPSNSVVT